MDRYLASKAAGGFAVIGGGAGLAAALGGGPIAAVIAAYAGVIAGLIEVCGNENGYVVMYMHYGGSIPFCNPFA